MIPPTGSVFTWRAAPHPKRDRSEVIATDGLSEAEGKAGRCHIYIAHKGEVTGAREKTVRCDDLVSLALYSYSQYSESLLWSWQDKHAVAPNQANLLKRFNTVRKRGRLSA